MPKSKRRRFSWPEVPRVTQLSLLQSVGSFSLALREGRSLTLALAMSSIAEKGERELPGAQTDDLLIEEAVLLGCSLTAS